MYRAEKKGVNPIPSRRRTCCVVEDKEISKVGSFNRKQEQSWRISGTLWDDVGSFCFNLFRVVLDRFDP